MLQQICSTAWVLIKMGKFSRDKGKRGELELAHKLQELGFPDAHRSQQYCGSASSADVLGLPGVHIEVKRTEALSLYKAYNQAVRDVGSSEEMPVIFHRRNGKPWLVVMSLRDWAKLYHNYVDNSEVE